MKRAKGVVMRISGNQTVIITSGGEFLEIPTPKDRPMVGQVIDVNLSLQKPFFKRSVMKYAAAAVVLFLVMSLALFNPFFGPGLAAAYVALDIQNGVELYINQEGQVIEVRNISENTNQIHSRADLIGRDIYQAVGLILQEAGSKGILEKEQNLVMASVVQVSEKRLNVVDEKKLRDIIRNEMLGKKVSGYVMVRKINENIKRQAESHRMTVNNYLVYERCRKDGIDIQPEAFHGGDIRELLEEANTSLPGLFPDECIAVGKRGHLGTMGTDGKRLGNVSSHIMEQVHSPGNNNSINETRQPGHADAGHNGSEQNNFGQQGMLGDSQKSYDNSEGLARQGYRYSGGMGEHHGP